MFDHDREPPETPLPDRPLDQLQVVEARHVLLHVAQQAQGLRTTLGAMFARSDQRQLIATEKVQRGVQALIDDLAGLREKLGGRPDVRPVIHYVTISGHTICGREIRNAILVTSYPVQVTCLSCALCLRAQERNEG